MVVYILLLLACGGPAALDEPAAPPEWPMTNLLVSDAAADDTPDAPEQGAADGEAPADPSDEAAGADAAVDGAGPPPQPDEADGAGDPPSADDGADARDEAEGAP